ncbi:MAG TPA: ester cyclase [Candidatus Saccharimonadales bacterium]|nr:ester cyclase [Candidatus Saccharimonadales bacterium]
MTETEKNKAVIRRYFDEVWSKGDTNILNETHYPDYEIEKLPPWREPGVEGLKEFIKDNHRMFPDVQAKVEDLIAEANKVVARVSFTGTHKGDLVGPVGLVPATNKKVTFRGIFIFELHDSKVMKAWSVTDNMELMQQLGAVPNPRPL